jgi:hypothetical protein
MTQETTILKKLEEYIFENYESGEFFEEWCEDYDYIAVDFDGPYVNEDTNEPDNNCILYLINIDRHLSERLEAENKYELPQEYDLLYGWVHIDLGFVDIVGLDNYYGENKSKLISNLDTFLKHVDETG